MAKSNAGEVTIEVKVDPASVIRLLEPMREHHEEALKNIDLLIAKYRGEAPAETEIYIIDAAALPAEYYLRESVQAAILAEIRKDYQNTNQLPAGASLKNEVEARSGETEKISDKEDDSVERGAGSEDPERGADNGSETGGGDPDPGGQSSESDSERGSESGKGPSK